MKVVYLEREICKTFTLFSLFAYSKYIFACPGCTLKLFFCVKRHKGQRINEKEVVCDGKKVIYTMKQDNYIDRICERCWLTKSCFSKVSLDRHRPTTMFNSKVFYRIPESQKVWEMRVFFLKKYAPKKKQILRSDFADLKADLIHCAKQPFLYFSWNLLSAQWRWFQSICVCLWMVFS